MQDLGLFHQTQHPVSKLERCLDITVRLHHSELSAWCRDLELGSSSVVYQRSGVNTHNLNTRLNICTYTSITSSALFHISLKSDEVLNWNNETFDGRILISSYDSSVEPLKCFEMLFMVIIC